MSEAILSLVVDTSKMLPALQRVETALGNLGAQAVKVGAILSASITAPITIMAKQSIAAWTGQEDATAALTAALRNNGDEVERNVVSFEAFASEIQKVTKYGDEMLTMQAAQLRNFGVMPGQLQDATRAAVGLASKYRMDLATAVDLLGKAYQGQTQTLARYGIILDENLSSTEKFNEILRRGAGAFSLAEAETKTLSGAYVQLVNIVGDMYEVFGKAVIEGLHLVDVSKFLGDNVKSVTAWIDSLSSTTKMVVVVFAGFAAIIPPMILSLGTLALAFNQVTAAMITLIGLYPKIVVLSKGIGLLSVKGALVAATFGAAFWTGTAVHDWLRDNSEMFRKFEESVSGALHKTGQFIGIFKSQGELDKDVSDFGKSMADRTEEIINKGLVDFRMTRDQLARFAKERGTGLVGALGMLRSGNTSPVAQATPESFGINRQKQFADLAIAGSVEAYKAEISRVGADEQIANSTKKTADNTGEMLRVLRSQSGTVRMGTI